LDAVLNSSKNKLEICQPHKEKTTATTNFRRPRDFEFLVRPNAIHSELKQGSVLALGSQDSKYYVLMAILTLSFLIYIAFLATRQSKRN